MSNDQINVRDDARNAGAEPSAFHAELNQHLVPLELAAGHPGGPAPAPPRPEPPRPAPPPPRPEPPRPAPRPEPPRPQPRPEPRPQPPRPQPRPEPRPQPPRPQPPRPEPHPPRPQPPRPEPHPPRPEPHPPKPQPPRPEPHPPKPEPHPPKPEPHPPRPEPHPPKPEPHPPRPEPHPPKPEPHPPRPEPHPPRPEPHPPHPHPEPRPHPHPGPDPEHGGFHPGRPFHPPEGRHWGWHDEERWGRGWDPWFFRQDPNWEQWRDPIRDEAANIAQRLDLGDAQGAADELASDLYAMKGDRYAQDQLLSSVNVDELKGVGADISLNAWNPDRGTWDDIQILPADGSPSIPITAYDYEDPTPWLNQQ